MKILMINSTDIQGGAAIAANRLLMALDKTDLNSQMLVQTKLGNSNIIKQVGNKVTMYLDLLPLLFYPKWKRVPFYSAMVSDGLKKLIKKFNPEVIHLHNITRGFVKLENIPKYKKPIVWTFHDFWPVTGGCSSPGNCERYLIGCGKCPLLGSAKEKDLSWYNWQRKKQMFETTKGMTIITPSLWLSKKIENSPLISKKQINVIPHAINSNDFYKIEKNFARQKLDLPAEKKILTFGANHFERDKNKGFDLFYESIKLLPESTRKETMIILYGSKTKSVSNIIPGWQVISKGYLKTEDLRILYNASDCTVMPSRQETFGLIALESMMCGTPVVVFDTSGLAEVVEHKLTGYKAIPYDITDLSKGIEYVLKNQVELSENTLKIIQEKYSMNKMVLSHLNLYKNCIDSSEHDSNT